MSVDIPELPGDKSLEQNSSCLSECLPEREPLHRPQHSIIMQDWVTEARKTIEQILKWVLPAQVFAQLKSMRARKYSLKVLQENGLLEISSRVMEHCGTTVLKGPFSGLRFPAEVLLNLPCAQRILGSYEKELHPIFQNLNKKTDYEAVIDIGSAEGYYAVGLALLLHLPVFAFDVDPEERRRCKKTAELNGIGSLLRIGAYCDGPTLRKLAHGKRCFIVSDCEGYEMELFDHEVAADLRHSDVLVEIHEEKQKNVFESICRAFVDTHLINIHKRTTRNTDEYPELCFLGADATKAIEEWRDSGQKWVFLQSRENQGHYEDAGRVGE